MEISIVRQMSREFLSEDTIFIHDLSNNIDTHFKEKTYCEYVKSIYIGLICVSKGFEPFFKVRPPKLNKKDFFFEYEFKLDFEEFYNADKSERLSILIRELIKATKEAFQVKKVPGFDSEKFINDLKEFLKSNYGY